jgi:glycine/D-amino acid oxidase-like deaminating enzyme/nitrite reductase/ring-hydroxylating ferredoxin subunit
LIRIHGEKIARKYFEFNEQGIKRIGEIIEKEKIDCDFQKVNGYLFAVKEEEEAKIEKEYRAYQSLGIKGEMVKIDPKISTLKALKVTDQANFHPTKYLRQITDILLSSGVRIYEGTRIRDVYQDDGAVALTSERLRIKAEKIIITSHYPIYKGFNFYFMKMMPKISYAILSHPTDLEIENANYSNTITNPSIALRFIKTEEGLCLNISGASHDAKKFTSYLGQVEILKDFGKKHFQITEYPYVWCAQDYTSTDHLPLIGKVDEHILIAASFNKWGMATALATGMLIKDIINNHHSDFEEIFRPRRVKLTGKLLTYNLGMICTLLKTRNLPKRHLLRLAPGTGKVTKMGMKRIGIYKDENRQLHIVDVTCPHMRCGLRFNPLEKTYDCKCHGSRFDYSGKLLDGPARRDLYSIPLAEIKEYIQVE